MYYRALFSAEIIEPLEIVSSEEDGDQALQMLLLLCYPRKCYMLLRCVNLIKEVCCGRVRSSRSKAIFSLLRVKVIKNFRIPNLSLKQIIIFIGLSVVYESKGTYIDDIGFFIGNIDYSSRDFMFYLFIFSFLTLHFL